MINQGRTLLLNRDGFNRPLPTYFLEEYVDPLFKALSIPAELQSVYEVLVGTLADNAYANFRMRQYMLILHSTEFAEYVTALDPRVTYLEDRTAVDTLFSSSAAALNNLATPIPVSFSGQPRASTPSRVSATATVQAIPASCAVAIPGITKIAASPPTSPGIP